MTHNLRNPLDMEMIDWLQRKGCVAIECELRGGQEIYTIDDCESYHQTLRRAIQHSMAEEEPKRWAAVEPCLRGSGRGSA